MSAYHFKYFQNIQFKNHGIPPTPPDLPTLKAYPTPGAGGRFGIFSLKWRERMNLKVPGAILPLGCAILSTRARTVRGVGTTLLRRTRFKMCWYCPTNLNIDLQDSFIRYCLLPPILGVLEWSSPLGLVNFAKKKKKKKNHLGLNCLFFINVMPNFL